MAGMRMLRDMSSTRKSASPEKGAEGCGEAGELSRNEGITLARQTHILWSLFRTLRSHVGTPRSVLPNDPDSPCYASQKPEGREHLRNLLNWEKFDEVRDSRRSILLDTFYESIIFAVGKGFPWVEVVKVVKFTQELLKDTKGCSITQAITILRNKLSDYQGQFNTTHLLALCDYFYNTFIRHYRLYQYVLGQGQEVNLTINHVEVCVPPQPLPLAEGKDRDLCNLEQQLAELTTAEMQKRTNVLLLKEALHLEQEHMLQKKFSEMSVQQRRVLKREELENLINEAIHIQIKCLKELLQYEIQTTFDILDLKLQKKTLNLNAPIPFPLSISGQPGQDESLKTNKARKAKKAKDKRHSKDSLRKNH